MEIKNEEGKVLSEKDRIIMEQKAATLIQRVGATLISSMPFFAALFLNTRRKVDWSQPTMYASPACLIGYNPSFVCSLELRGIRSAILHELYHLIANHAGRRRERDHMLFNIACVKGDTIIAGDYKPIANLKAGDNVFGKTTSEKVVSPIQNVFKGDMLSIKGCGLLPVEVTPEHPILISRLKVTSKGRQYLPPEWIPAKDLQEKSMYMCVPIMQGTNNITQLDLTAYAKRLTHPNWKGQIPHHTKLHTLEVTKETAQIIGLYVAEGSRMSNKAGGLQFSLNKNETYLISTVLKWGRSLGYSAKVYFKDNTAKVCIPSTVLGFAFSDWFGCGSKNKKLPDWILEHSDLTIIKAVLDGMIAGDGSVDHNGRLIYGTSSKILAMQMQLLIARLGEFAQLRVEHRKERKLKAAILPPQILYSVDWGTPKITERNLMGKTIKSYQNRWRKLDNYIITPIINITKYPYAGTVYNITTTDHSYLVSNAVVHNCDSEINNKLKRLGNFIPEGWVLFPQWDGQNAEYIYAQLIKDAKQQPKNGNGKDGNGCSGVKNVDGNGKPMTAAQVKKAMGQLKQKVAQAAQAARSKGDLPEDLERMLQDLLSPKLNWEQILEKFIQEAVQDDYDDNKFDRRFIDQELYFEDLCIPKASIAIAIDSSGSISGEELNKAVAETLSIVQARNISKIRLIVCDAEVHSDQVYNAREFDVADFRIGGGGGTDFRPIFKALEEGEKPSVLVFFTDTYGTMPEEEPDYPTLWVVWGDTDTDTLPFGIGVNYDT